MTAASPVLPTRVLAGRNHFTYWQTPVVQATPDYSAGDVIGGKIEVLGAAREKGTSGAVVSLFCYSSVDIASDVPISVVFFRSDPTNSTFTENGAFVVHANDLQKIIGAVILDQHIDAGTPVIKHAAVGVKIPFVLDAEAGSIFAVAIAGGTINLGGTADLTFSFGIEQD